MNDIITIQAQLDRLVADEKSFENGIAQRTELIQKLYVEIDQHRGALAYNQSLSQLCRKQLVELVATQQSQ